MPDQEPNEEKSIFDQWGDIFESFGEKPFFKVVVKLSALITTIVVFGSLFVMAKTTNHDGVVYNYINEPKRAETRHQKLKDWKYQKADKYHDWRIKHYPGWLVDLQDISHPVVKSKNGK